MYKCIYNIYVSCNINIIYNYILIYYTYIYISYIYLYIIYKEIVFTSFISNIMSKEKSFCTPTKMTLCSYNGPAWRGRSGGIGL